MGLTALAGSVVPLPAVSSHASKTRPTAAEADTPTFRTHEPVQRHHVSLFLRPAPFRPLRQVQGTSVQRASARRAISATVSSEKANVESTRDREVTTALPPEASSEKAYTEGTSEKELNGTEGSLKTESEDGKPVEGGLSDSAAIGQGSAVLGVTVVALISAIGAFGYFYKDEVNQAVAFFSEYIESAGPLGYVAFTFGYTILEILAIPAIPLTMSAGLLFGPVIGTVICSAAATMAATGSFLIARYVARDRILNLVKGNKKYLAIDKAVGEDSFRVVALLRLSPLLPFSLGNYVYGLTSVKLLPYILASWIGMLPGTYAYVSAGSFGRTLLDSEEQGLALSNSSLWTLLAGLGVTVAAAAYVTNIAKNAVKDLD